MELVRPDWFSAALQSLLAGQPLDAAVLTQAFRDLLTGRVDEPFAASFLTALRFKGETADEIAGAATVLREQMVRLTPISGPVLDTCGTGGDDSGTFNISTATSIVVAAAGVPVVKHGNRAVSSRSGSADVLRELGVEIEAGPVWSQRCLDRIGFAFCFAPHFHDGMKNVAKLRRALGIRTIFNLLGPLANPANADFQLLGVGKPELLDTLASATARLGTRRAVLVCSHDGLDEVSLSAPTRVRIVEGETFSSREWTPDDFGLAAVSLAEIRADGPGESAAIIRSVLNNDDTPARRIVLANAAAALWTAEKVSNLRDGVALADEAVRNGTARSLLEQLVRMR
ncbi:anthranilate phosphoribosyltransferase [Limnoglobus roseus]|uniref:Anthranilate phosphoribosyltransferase n=1 Tax=Limnoglobus roseus TaxID=2598579 RepID=A0A5C1AGE5_9BACT|nr:anthranilate phosphoribosyltransferase [Limnoglobus roseus]QEL18281.1 anthranilate phosphoribosyltransferase [Limnoglobus roseus]